MYCNTSCTLWILLSFINSYSHIFSWQWIVAIIDEEDTLLHILGTVYPSSSHSIQTTIHFVGLLQYLLTLNKPQMYEITQELKPFLLITLQQIEFGPTHQPNDNIQSIYFAITLRYNNKFKQGVTLYCDHKERESCCCFFIKYLHEINILLNVEYFKQ